MDTHIYVLAKNESANIQRCLESLARCDSVVAVLDSGSSDDTWQKAESFSNVSVEEFRYTNHCDAYNHLTSAHSETDVVIVLDADMRLSKDLFDEATTVLREHATVDAVIAPVHMYWVGIPLKAGSLYPPKAVVFRGGQSYFEPTGHGETLRRDVEVARVAAPLIHDDRRDFEDELLKQWRYANTTRQRTELGHGTWRDKVRSVSSIAVITSPIASLLLRGGWRAGRIGQLYALDRLIAEALSRRAFLAHQVRQSSAERHPSRTR